MAIRHVIFRVLFSVIALGGFFGCKESILTEEIVLNNDFSIAAVDDSIPIMASDLYNRLKDSKLLREGGFLDSSTYFETLEDIVVDTLVSLEARDIDLAVAGPNQYRTYRNRYRGVYIDYLFKKIIIDSILVDFARVDSFYRAHPDQFVRLEQIRARHIVTSAEGLRHGFDSTGFADYSQEQLDSVAKVMITDYRAQIDSGVDFGDIAEQYSMHRPSGQNRGDLGYFARNTYSRDFEDVTFGLDTGVVHGPFKTADGWHLVEVLDHLDSGLVPLEGKVYEAVVNRLTSEEARERSIAFLDSIYSAAEYVYNDSDLTRPIGEVPETTWALIINGRDSLFFRRLDINFADYGKFLKKDTLNLDDKHDMLQRLARPYIVAQAGDDLGLDRDSAISAERRALYHQYSANVVRQYDVDPDYQPTDSMIADYYNRHIDQFVFEKPVYVQHIIAEDSIFGEFLRDQALSGVEFLDLAKEHYPGAEEIRVAAADLGYIGRGEMPEAFFEKAMSTKLGDISHPVKTDWGYHIIKVLDKRLNKTLESQRVHISAILKDRYLSGALKQWRTDILSRYKVEYFLDQLKKIELSPSKERNKSDETTDKRAG